MRIIQRIRSSPTLRIVRESRKDQRPTTAARTEEGYRGITRVRRLFLSSLGTRFAVSSLQLPISITRSLTSFFHLMRFEHRMRHQQERGENPTTPVRHLGLGLGRERRLECQNTSSCRGSILLLGENGRYPLTGRVCVLLARRRLTRPRDRTAAGPSVTAKLPSRRAHTRNGTKVIIKK